MKSADILKIAIAAALLSAVCAHAQPTLKINAANAGEGRFLDFTRLGAYQNFSFYLSSNGGVALPSQPMKPNGICELPGFSGQGDFTLQWTFLTNRTDTGCILVPISVKPPENPEFRFKPKTSGDYKNEQLAQIRRILATHAPNRLDLAAARIQESEDLADLMRPADLAESPTITEKFVINLMKEVGNDAIEPRYADESFEYGMFATNTLVAMIKRSADFTEDETLARVGDAFNLWLTIHDLHCLKGRGSQAWGPKLIGDNEVYPSAEAKKLFKKQLVQILKYLQANYESKASNPNGLRGRISRNEAATQVPEDIKLGLQTMDRLLKLDLNDSTDQTIDEMQLGILERAIRALNWLL